MKILLVHNFYRSGVPSGENVVFFAEKALLIEHGHEVIEYTRHSDEITRQGIWGAFKGACSVPWNPFVVRKLKKILECEKPDILHVHNSFPLLSPAIFYAAKKSQAATVLTLHNYRLYCAAGIPLRSSKSCTDCLDKQSVIPALRYGCYRGSRVATLPLALSIAFHRFMGTWKKKVDAFITLTNFQYKTMRDAGLPYEKIYTKPQFYANPPDPIEWGERDDTVVFVGRLGKEKGVRFLIEAWKHWGKSAPTLKIIGDGPESENLKKMAQKAKNIHFLGQIPFEQVQAHLAYSKLTVVPSIWFEGFPMVIREAFALGVPVAASRLGSMECLVSDESNGVLFNAGNEADLLDKVRSVWQDEKLLAKMGVRARVIFDGEYTADINYKYLMAIYRSAIKRKDEEKNG